ncbi:unnamed protein product [Nezara viridula]|uniref:Uncharacterized protein n=1 Tax=Nezara viridula TaxID=85310 RepID=A0A9P0HRQ4_NEZVI|nr:unnamed protein product [Nezara viridula]
MIKYHRPFVQLPSIDQETIMSVQDDIAILRPWIMKQAHFPEDIDDHLIKRFLAVCEGSLEKTKATMDHFFCLRSEAPEFFTERDPLHHRMQEVFSLIDLLPLPQLTPEGYKCFMYKVADPNPEKFCFNDYVKNFFLVGDTRVKTETNIPKGEIVIFDMKGYSLRHLTKIPLVSVRKYMQYTQLHFHQPGATTLYDYVPQEILPSEYGGKAGAVADIKGDILFLRIKRYALKNYLTHSVNA